MSKYIPQAPPFVMIDDVLVCSGTETETVFKITNDNVFVEDGFFTEPGLIENMAQTAAAGTGWLAHQNQQQPPVGYIGAVKDLTIHALPKAGDTIVSSIRTMHQVMNAYIVEGTVRCGDRLIASAEFKIFLQ